MQNWKSKSRPELGSCCGGVRGLMEVDLDQTLSSDDIKTRFLSFSLWIQWEARGPGDKNNSKMVSESSRVSGGQMGMGLSNVQRQETSRLGRGSGSCPLRPPGYLQAGN